MNQLLKWAGVTVGVCAVLLGLMGCSNPSSDNDDTYTMTVTSAAFQNESYIPAKYAHADCGGENISPPLQWSNPHPLTESFALECVDPDAPDSAWTHWVVFNIPGQIRSIPEGVAFSGGIVQGVNDWGLNEWGGPCPPSGTHRYVFVLYALDTTLNADANTTRSDLEEAMYGHVLERGRLIGLYKAQ